MDRIPPAAQFVIRAAVFAYCLGFELGAWVHRASAALAAAHVQALGLAPEAPRPELPAPQLAIAPQVVAIAESAPSAVVATIHPLAVIALDLETLPMSKLRALTGIRRRVSKTQIIGAYLQLT